MSPARNEVNIQYANADTKQKRNTLHYVNATFKLTHHNPTNLTPNFQEISHENAQHRLLNVNAYIWVDE